MEPLQSNNFTYVSIETLRNAFPKVQGQSATEPVKPVEADVPPPQKKASGKS